MHTINLKQVAGNHANIYEVYFAAVEKQGTVPAVDAAKFLKKSELPDSVLSKIWDLSDPNGKGFLNKAGFYTALKLVSLAQLGHEVSLENIMMEIPPPKLTGVTVSASPRPSLPTINSVPATVNDWKMTPAERMKYETLFNSLHPLNGVIPGNKVKGLLSDSKLPFPVLGKIWDLADMDKDGSLDRHEFTVAMHLVYKALEDYTIPNSLPPELLPPDKMKNSLPTAPVAQPMINGGPTWVVGVEERVKYDRLFINADVDKDGYVSGNEIKDIFLQSGVPQPVLANIWGLCDMKQTGKLNKEQFSLAMWLIQRKLKGIDPPPSLTPDMIPPSMRQQHPQTDGPSVHLNPELDMISKDIEELLRDKMTLEKEIIGKEAEIKVKSGEAISLQEELDTLAATLKQLDNQKGEAGKRLNDLKNQVEKLKKDAEEQELLVKQQEDELINKKKELENLKAEEVRLGTKQNELNKQLEELSNQLQESQLTISQAKTKISDIHEHQRQLKEAIDIIDKALNECDTSVPNRYLELEPDFRDPAYTRLINPVETEDAPRNEPLEITNNNRTDNFTHSAFKEDPFASNNAFSAAFPEQPSKMGFGNDPFSSFPMGAGTKNDPFDPFHSSGPQNISKSSEEGDHDAFGCEPFGAPAPALPPKNKQPPPRPAPPRPAPPPAQTTSDSFADFSNFNSKDQNLDFTEDPFKNYRYEDIFNIEDPFEEHVSSKYNKDLFSNDDPFSPVKINPINGKYKSCEELLQETQSQNTKVGSDLVLNKETKCDSLPSLLS